MVRYILLGIFICLGTIIIIASGGGDGKDNGNNNAQENLYPYPQHTDYVGDFIKPQNYTQSELDEITASFYMEWQDKYIKSDCAEDEYYVDFDEGSTICVSEGLGYGMIITAIMAGYDADAKSYFDGMYRFYKSHPSSINPLLMAWEQIDGCITNPDGGGDSASDGDMDIAYALLLANRQWGNDGDINYLEEAKKIIAAIMQDEVNPETFTVKPGDWADSSQPLYYYSTRTSDFIMDHFRAFTEFSADQDWNKVIDTCYVLINSIQTDYSPATGLIPDFIINCDSAPVPAEENFLESEYDGAYYYNACRDPWRIATDYLISGDARGKNALNAINSWLIASTGGNPENIKSGYLLDGTQIGGYQDVAFIGAFAVSAMLETQNQQWLDKLFELMTATAEGLDDNGYFGNTLKVMYLLTISGNYWSP
ncbi:MAG: beta-glucanase [Deltaproteobacteria bacterium]|nr:beta-glucanase [Deltaproteobacteria bacterium]